jgi:Protein of unknown function (DUF3592)
MRYSGRRIRIPLRGPWALAAGAICVGLAVYQGLVRSTLATRGIETEARVVDVDSRSRRKGFGRTYRLTLQFEDGSGSAWRGRTGYSGRHDRHAVGDRVAILYNPNDPSELALDSWYELWAWPLGFAALGSVGCSLFLSGRRARVPVRGP